MSLIKFELKEDHVKLLKQLRWGIKDKLLVSTDNPEEDNVPFGGDDLYEEMYIILYGKPKNFDVNATTLIRFNDDEINNMNKLFSELPIALDIVLYNGSYELGNYKTKAHIRNWVKIP